MSIALRRSEGGGGGAGAGGATGRYRIDPPRLISKAPFMAMYDSPDPLIGSHGGGGEGEKDPDSDSCSSSSIGKNSDPSVDSEEDDSGENEAQSGFSGPLDTLDSLEDVLPVKRGISSFYAGKSKSFASLADAASISTIKDLAKPDNVYSKKRKNLLASTIYLEKKADKTPKQNSGGLCKRLASGSRGDWSDSSSSVTSNSNSSSSSPSCGLPPLHPRSTKGGMPNVELSLPPSGRSVPPCRSLSLSDLKSVN